MSTIIIELLYASPAVHVGVTFRRIANPSGEKTVALPDCDCILLDIEGTTSSISFVHDEMFPYARDHVESFLETHWSSAETIECVQLIAKDLGDQAWPDSSLNADEQRAQIVAEVHRQMDQDLKATGLKSLQGKIWKAGFEAGELQAHVYPDVLPALESWKAAGIDLKIYSSGSVQAQHLFFAHTIVGDLLRFFSAHYDTKIGGKKESSSYKTIVKDSGIDPSRILFISDVLEELDAANLAGLQTCLSIRPGNTPVAASASHPSIESFAELTK